MSMYLPNPAVHPSESDPVEFIEPPSMAHEVEDETGTSVEPQRRPIVGLSPQARVDVARRAHDYITELVASYGGDQGDVRSIIETSITR
jgi:hypothetical protein